MLFGVPWDRCDGHAEIEFTLTLQQSLSEGLSATRGGAYHLHAGPLS